MKSYIRKNFVELELLHQHLEYKSLMANLNYDYVYLYRKKEKYIDKFLNEIPVVTI